MNKKLWMTAALALSLSSAEAVANTLEEGNLVAVCDNVGKFVSQRPKKSERLFKSDAVEKKIADEKSKKDAVLGKYAGENKVIRQLVDLALLQNNMLKGEALTNFVKRSIEMI